MNKKLTVAKITTVQKVSVNEPEIEEVFFTEKSINEKAVRLAELLK